MKAVMLSIQPKWCELIASGRKTIEVRKTRPSIETPFKCYIYCTAKKIKAVQSNHDTIRVKIRLPKHAPIKRVSYTYPCFQKVIGEFVCDKVSPFYYGNMDYPIPTYDGDDSVCEIGDGYYITSGELVETCLTYEQIENYGKSKTLYGLHISDLKIYYTPKELREFFGYGECEPDPIKCHACKYMEHGNSWAGIEADCNAAYDGLKQLRRPPQSWCYVEEIL